MLEKLAWMKRSTERIRLGLNHPADVQDHFLSFIHASHLLFFYFGGWVKDIGKAPSAKELIEQYVASLDLDSATIWKFLQNLRTEDVHTKPVTIVNIESPGALTFKGQTLTLNGAQLMFGKYRYVVELSGTSHDVLHVCDVGLAVKGRFCEEFDSI